MPLFRKTTPESRFDAVVRPHFDALYGSARRLAASEADAEDLLQELFIRAFVRLDKLEKIEHRRAWLLKVLYNLFIDGRRSAARSAVGNAETGDESVSADDIADPRWQPEDDAERDIRVERILKAMRLLDANHCALVAMHDIDGLTVEELSELTGEPAGTIKSRLSRTRARLGRILATDTDLRPQLAAVGDKQ